MGINRDEETIKLNRVSREVEILKAAIEVFRAVRNFSCAERAEIEAKVKDIIR